MSQNALVIESRQGNFSVLSRFLEKMDIRAVNVERLENMNKALSSEQSFSVAIIDIMGFDDIIWDCCKNIDKKGIPMLIISPARNSGIIKISFKHGARDVLKKPVIMKELADSIRSLISSKE